MKPKFLFACGMIAPLIYLGALVFGWANYPGYEPFFQAVSELIAAGAPTKAALDVVFFTCALLIGLFSLGIYLNVDRAPSREGRKAAALGALTLAAVSLLGLLILAFPMDPPGRALALSDYTLRGKLHVALASLMSAGSLPAVLLIGFWLRKQPHFAGLARYSFVTGGLLFVVGSITAVIYFSHHFLLGVFERLTFALFFQWLLVAGGCLCKMEWLPGWDERNDRLPTSETTRIYPAI